MEAIYTSLERETALAEAEAAIAAQPFRPAVRRDLHRLRVALSNVIDLSDAAVLERLGVPLPILEAESRRAAARIGNAVAMLLGHDGALVPSVRRVGGTNLVIYPNNQERDAVFEVVSSEVIAA